VLRFPDVSAASLPEAETSAPSLTSRLLSKRTVLSFGAAAIILAAAIWRADIPWGETWNRIRHADLRLYALALIVYYAEYIVRGARWKVLLRNAGENRRLVPLTEILLVSFFVNCVVPAKMGDIYRAVLVRQRERVPATKAFGTVVAERLIDLLVLMSLLVVAAALSFHAHVPHFLVPYLIAGGVLCAIGVSALLMMRMGRGQRLLRLLPEHVVGRYESFRHGAVHAMGRWHEVLPLSVAIWALEATRLGLIVFALSAGALLGPAQFLLVALIAALLTTVPFTPGGVGLVELGMVGVLINITSIPRSAAVSIALLDRSVSYLSLVVVGFIVFTAGHVRVENARVNRRAEA
jgi:uncharacterized protein (TIRG00374 family)